jgi:hypothetical protein
MNSEVLYQQLVNSQQANIKSLEFNLVLLNEKTAKLENENKTLIIENAHLKRNLNSSRKKTGNRHFYLFIYFFSKSMKYFSNKLVSEKKIIFKTK